MAKSSKKNLPGKKVTQLSFVTMVSTLLFGGIVLVVVFVLFQKVRAYQNVQATLLHLDEQQELLSQQLMRDLFFIGMHKGTCWEPAISVKNAGRTLELKGSNAQFAAIVKTPTSNSNRNLILSSIDGLRPGINLRLCFQNMHEEISVEKVFDRGAKEQQLPENAIQFIIRRNGYKVLQQSFPKGTSVIQYQEITYEFVNGQIVRIENQRARQTLATAKNFNIKVTAGSTEEYKFSFTLLDPVSKIEKSYELTWSPWYNNPGLTTEEIINLYEN